MWCALRWNDLTAGCRRTPAVTGGQGPNLRWTSRCSVIQQVFDPTNSRNRPVLQDVSSQCMLYRHNLKLDRVCSKLWFRLANLRTFYLRVDPRAFQVPSRNKVPTTFWIVTFFRVARPTKNHKDPIAYWSRFGGKKLDAVLRTRICNLQNHLCASKKKATNEAKLKRRRPMEKKYQEHAQTAGGIPEKRYMVSISGNLTWRGNWRLPYEKQPQEKRRTFYRLWGRGRGHWLTGWWWRVCLGVVAVYTVIAKVIRNFEKLQ